MTPAEFRAARLSLGLTQATMRGKVFLGGQTSVSKRPI